MRVVLHAINGTGVGHLTRLQLVLAALRQRVSGLEALLCTNAADPALWSGVGTAAEPEAVQLLRLPYTTADEAAAGDDPTPRNVNARAFFAAAAAFEPDLLLFDTHAPQALLRERAVEGIPRALILRTLTPGAAAKLFQSGMGAAFDCLILPGDLGAPPLAIPESLLPRVRRVLPIVRPAAHPAASARVAARFGILPQTRVVVATLGGGGPQLAPGKRALVHDAAAFGSAILAAFRSLCQSFPDARFFLQLGPYAPEPLVSELPQQLTIVRFDPDLPVLLQRADVAVALSGYNTVWELVQSRTPAILLCKRSRHESQRARAEALHDLGAVAQVLSEPDARKLAAGVAALLEDPQLRERLRLGMDRARPDAPADDRLTGALAGAAQTAAVLLELVADPPALQAPPPCESPCQGCPVPTRDALPLAELAQRGGRRVLIQCSSGQQDLAAVLTQVRAHGLCPVVETTGRMALQSATLRPALAEQPVLRPLFFGGFKKLHDRACGLPGSFAATLELAQAAGAPVPAWRLRTLRQGVGREDALRPIDRQVLLRAKKDLDRADAGPIVAYLRRRWLPYSEVFIYNEVRALRRYRPLVLCKETAGSPLPGVPVLPLGDVPPDRLAPLLSGVRVLHGVFLTCSLSFLGLAQALGVPLLVSARGHDVYRRPASELQPVFAQAARVLARTEQMAQDLIARGCPAAKIEVLPTGLLLPRFPFRLPLPPAADAPLEVIAVGRFVAKKGTLDLLRAFAVLAKEQPRARLTVYGRGHVNEDPAELAAALSLGDSPLLHGRVRLLPAVPQEQLAHELRRSHLYLCASKLAPDGDREGLPNALKEAMAVGLPVLSPAHGAISELLGGTTPCGVLVPEGDPQALGEALLDLVRTPERWPELAKNARARVEQRFAMERIITRLEELYDQVLLGAAVQSGTPVEVRPSPTPSRSGPALQE